MVLQKKSLNCPHEILTPYEGNGLIALEDNNNNSPLFRRSKADKDQDLARNGAR